MRVNKEYIDGRLITCGRVRRVTYVSVVYVLVLVAALIGCYGPLDTDASDNTIVLDLSGFIRALQIDPPGEDGFVIDIYLFHPEDVTLGTSYVDVSSRQNSVPINGKQFERIVFGVDITGIAPPDSLTKQDTIRIGGVPPGGPYVMLVLVWNNNDPEWDSPVWLTAADEQLVTFTIRAGETTRIRSQDIELFYSVYFVDDNDFFGGT